MNELTLAPFAAVIVWTRPRPTPVAAWQAIFSALLEMLAKRAASEGDTVIGHIKGFAELPESGFIQTSVVSAARPAACQLNGDPDAELVQLTLALNFLVYGLPFDRAEMIFKESVVRVAKEYAVDAFIRSISDPTHHSHDHHHHTHGQFHP